MHNFWNELVAIFRSPPDDASVPSSQANSYREVIALQAIFVTLTIALLAYLQREPMFQVRVDIAFVLLAGVPMIGLYQIVRGRTRTQYGEVYVYTRPIRAYARQSLFLDVLIVLGVSYSYWQGQLPGQ